MSLVNTETGEVVEVMGEQEARRLVNRVNRAATDLVNSIERIWRGRAWLALGHDSWDDLCDAEFSDLPRLGREQRTELVRSLRSIGMSTRAIASAAGVDKRTVSRDLATGADAPVREQPQEITGVNGKTYSRITSTSRDVEQIVREVVADEERKRSEKAQDRQAIDEMAHNLGLPAPGTPEAREANRRLEIIATALGWIRDFERRDMHPADEVIELAEDTDVDVLHRAKRAHAWLSDLLAATERKFG